MLPSAHPLPRAAQCMHPHQPLASTCQRLPGCPACSAVPNGVNPTCFVSPDAAFFQSADKAAGARSAVQYASIHLKCLRDASHCPAPLPAPLQRLHAPWGPHAPPLRTHLRPALRRPCVARPRRRAGAREGQGGLPVPAALRAVLPGLACHLPAARRHPQRGADARRGRLLHFRHRAAPEEVGQCGAAGRRAEGQAGRRAGGAAGRWPRLVDACWAQPARGRAVHACIHVRQLSMLTVRATWPGSTASCSGKQQEFTFIARQEVAALEGGWVGWVGMGGQSHRDPVEGRGRKQAGGHGCARSPAHHRERTAWARSLGPCHSVCDLHLLPPSLLQITCARAGCRWARRPARMKRKRRLVARRGRRARQRRRMRIRTTPR